LKKNIEISENQVQSFLETDKQQKQELKKQKELLRT